jgi:hypothetical protein
MQLIRAIPLRRPDQLSPASFLLPVADIPKDIVSRSTLRRALADSLDTPGYLCIPGSLHARFGRRFQALQECVRQPGSLILGKRQRIMRKLFYGEFDS